ncbi:MAG: HlyD family type I secretion periplasmic adaptor subunit [Holosporales bacterium]
MLTLFKEKAADSVFLMRLVKAKEVWKHSVQEEAEKPHLKRSRHELEFLPAALEVMETPPSPTARLTAWLILALFTVALVWSILGFTDVVVTGQGQIIAFGNTRIIQSLEVAKISKINVREGQSIKVGDILVELDPTETQAETQKVGEALMQAALDVTRLRALADNPNNPEAAFVPPTNAPPALVINQKQLLKATIQEHRSRLSSFDASIRTNEAQQQTIQAEIKKLEQTIPLIRERADGLSSLASRGLAPRTQALQVQQELVNAKQDLSANRSRLNEVAATITNARQQREQAVSEYLKTRLNELSEAQQRFNNLRQELIKAKDRSGKRTITAPEDGTVQNLKINTVGGVVQPAEEIMRIVPSGGGLEALVRVLNKDRGGIEAGMPVQVKVDAYSFTKYGVINGQVREISSDAVLDEKLGPLFQVWVTLEPDSPLFNDKSLRITPGMTVVAEVKTDKRRIINYILSPIERGLKEAARER